MFQKGMMKYVGSGVDQVRKTHLRMGSGGHI